MGKLVKISATLVAMVCFFAFVGCEEPADTPTTKPDTTVKVEKVELNQAKLELTAGENKTLEATVTPANATDRTVTWTSSDDKVATVKDGKVTAVAEGTATITAEAGGKKAECTVSVKAKTYSLTKTEDSVGTVTFKVGDKEVAEAAANDEVTIVVTNTDASKEVVFEVKSGNDTISVTNRTFKMPAGDVTVKVFYKVAADPAHTTHTFGDWEYKDANTHWRKCEDPACSNDPETKEEAHDFSTGNTCSKCGYTRSIPATKVEIEQAENPLELVVGDERELNVVVTPNNSTDTPKWASDKEDVATVDDDGVVTAVGGGKATITVTAGKQTATREVQVFCREGEHQETCTKKDDTEHTVECSVCEKDLGSENHDFHDNDVCECGAHKPLSEFKVIKGKNGDIESMIDTPSALDAYKKNLAKYNFDNVTEPTAGNYEVTCEVNVTELQTATDGGAKNRKNIVAVLEFDELKAFAIGNISIKRDGTDDTVLGDTSWVSDAHLFVKDADEEYKTYVTLWMSMMPGADGTIPDRTYEIKAYAGDTSPKTLTFKFNDKPSEVGSFADLQKAVENDYANIKLVENITLPETLVISNNATIDLNGHTIDRGESWILKNGSDTAHGSHGAMIYIGEENPTEFATVTEKGAFKVLITDNNANRGKIDTGIYGIHAIYAQDNANVTLKDIEVTTSFEGSQAALVRAYDATITLNSAKVTAVGAKSDSIMVKTDQIGKVNIIDSEITGKGIGIQNWGTATVENSKVTADNKTIMALSCSGKTSTVNVKGSTIDGGIEYGAASASDPTPVVTVDSTSILKGLSLSVNSQYHAKAEKAFDLRINDAADITLAESAIKGDKIENGYLVKALQGCTGVKNSGGKLITVDGVGNVEVSE